MEEKEESLLTKLQDDVKSLTTHEENCRLKLYKLNKQKDLLVFYNNKKPPVQTRKEFDTQMKALQKQTRKAQTAYENAKFESIRARKRLNNYLVEVK